MYSNSCAVAAFSSLAALPLVVWRLSAPLAAAPRNAAGRETARDAFYSRHVRYLTVAGEDFLGAYSAVGHPFRAVDFHVAHPGD